MPTPPRHATDTTDPTPAGEPERGQAMVEFAMVLPILALILFAVVEFGLAFWHFQQVSAAASEGARRATVSRTSDDPAGAAVEAAVAAVPSLDQGDVDVSVSPSPPWSIGEPVTVTVRYPEDITVMGVTFFSNDLTVERTMRVEQ